jgi:hypothetical protein
MSVEELKEKLAALDADHRNEIIAYLVSLNDRDDPSRLARIERALNDKDPSRWITLEELEKRLGLGPCDKTE